MAIELDKENKEWVQNFYIKYKRKPRILHISNIANNAYINAKILNECGIENHVINNCYFAMGCPEWEDANIGNVIEDLWQPNWNKYNLNGFVRPRWFAHGDMATCIKYLSALCAGNDREADALFIELGKQNKTISSEPVLEKKSIIKKIRYYILSKIPEHQKRLCKYYLIKIKSKVFFSEHETVQEEFLPRKYSQWPSDDLLSDEFSKEFPNRIDKLLANEFTPYYHVRHDMGTLLKNYDLVIGYATEAVYPMMVGGAYFAFEHGTIRDIPYQQTSQGRICALTYRKAAHVLVTNFDCVPSANFLCPDKFTTINHPFDEDQFLSVADNWKNERDNMLSDLDADMLLFHPTRHDWVEGTGYADKANERFLKAFITLRNSGARVGVVCCEWGKNVLESRQLLDENNVSTYVHWINPLGVIGYTRMCMISDLVVDQFKLGGFGGVTYKALAAGRPVMAYINEDQIAARYPVLPPIINCQSEVEITEKLMDLYRHRDKLLAKGVNSRQWIEKFHSKSETVNQQIKQFRIHSPVK